MKLRHQQQLGNHDDVSKLCQFDSTNSSTFIRNSNVISVGKQAVDAQERHCIVFVEYDNCNDSITLTQEKGDVSSYNYTLTFKDGGKYGVRSLPNSLVTEFKIPIISKTNLFINDEYINSIPYYDLKFVRYDNWFDVNLDEESDDISLVINVHEANINKNADRETELEIYNSNDPTVRIKLLIKQPKNKLIRSDYSVLISGGDYFNEDTIKVAKIEFKPQKTEVYEDGSTVVVDSLESNFSIQAKCSSSDSSILEGNSLKLIDFDGTHIMKPIYHNIKTIHDVSLYIKTWIVDENDVKISKTFEHTLILQGSAISTYEYIFTYEDNSLYKELEWDEYDLEKKYLNIICKKQHFINGIFDCEEEIPFKYKIQDVNLDDTFSVFLCKTEDDKRVEKFYIYPNMDSCQDVDIIKRYKLIQDESNKELQLTLIQHPINKDKCKDIDLNVLVHCKNIEDDIWTDEKSKLIVTDLTNDKLVKEIPLSLCWLYNGIDNNCDYMYSGKISMIIGHEYNFKSEDIIKLLWNNNSLLCEYKIDETYLIENDDEGIDIIIEI